MEKNLVITNYDNFKDLSYFIGQHKKALEMIEEVQNFYVSFLKSKLVHSYELDAYPGKIVLKLFHKYLDTKFDVYSKRYDYHLKVEKYDDIFEGAEVKDKDGFRCKIIKCKEVQNRGWDRDYQGHMKKHVVIEYLEKPYYYTCAVDNSYIDRTKGSKEIDHLIYSCRNLDSYNAQEQIKKQLAELYRNFEKDLWFLPDPENGILRLFSTEDELRKFQFMFEDNFLVVYTKHHTGGTRTDRWMTFEYEGWQWHKFYFDINNGNFISEKNYLEKTYERKLDVHNGWHPYDDD